jgi:hypothetical protein
LADSGIVGATRVIVPCGIATNKRVATATTIQITCGITNKQINRTSRIRIPSLIPHCGVVGGSVSRKSICTNGHI